RARAKRDLIALPIRHELGRHMWWNEHRMTGERPLIAFRDRAAARKQIVQPIKLGEPDCRLDIGDAEIVTDLRILLKHGGRGVMAGKKRQRHTLMGQSWQPLPEGGGGCGNYSALPRGHPPWRGPAERPAIRGRTY